MKKLILAAVLFATPAVAQSISVLSGGVGAEERAQIEAVQNQYTLKVIFSVTGGDYVSDVGYSVTDANGTVVVDGIAGGPNLLLQLPTGKYEIDCALDNQHQTQKVSIAEDKLKTIQFRFKDQ